MTNYYEELKLDSGLSAKELQENLIRLEIVWTERASSRPEKAAETLVLINQAKKVFASEASRAEYDRELFASPKAAADDPDAARRAELEKWKKMAQDYVRSREYDMARMALDRAMQCADEDDVSLLQLAANICFLNSAYQEALSYTNRAILAAPNVVELYISKAYYIWCIYIVENNAHSSGALGHLQQARDTLEMASEMAAKQGDRDAQARADGELAYYLYFYKPKDVAQAEIRAKRALENRANVESAKKVLNDLAAKRTAAEKAAQEEQKRREELVQRERANREAQERASLAQRQKTAELENQKQRASSLYVLGWIAIVLSSILVFVQLGYTARMFAAVLLYGSAALLSYADTFKNGYSSGLILGVNAVLGIVNGLKTATASYVSMGYGALSAAKTWKIFLIMLVVYFALVFAAKAMGARANKKTRFK